MIEESRTRLQSQANMWQRILAVLEVTLLALLIPVARVGFKYLAPVGTFSSAIRQMGPGVIIIAPVVCCYLLLRGKDFKAYGITLCGWPEGLKMGVILSMMCAGFVLASLPILKHAGVDHFTPLEPWDRMIALFLALPGLALFVWVLRFSQSIAKRLPTVLACVALVVLWGVPLALARHFDKPLGPTLITFTGAVLVAGIGEELIFRGYIQSRLNEVFGRPFHFGGIQFGWGLFIASFLFGLVHIFNGIDFIHGPFNFQWSWGISAFLSGTFIFGYLREKTGSILSGAVLHGNNDAWALIVTNLKP